MRHAWMEAETRRVNFSMRPSCGSASVSAGRLRLTLVDVRQEYGFASSSVNRDICWSSGADYERRRLFARNATNATNAVVLTTRSSDSHTKNSGEWGLVRLPAVMAASGSARHHQDVSRDLEWTAGAFESVPTVRSERRAHDPYADANHDSPTPEALRIRLTPQIQV
jgi:hypothetical protein